MVQITNRFSHYDTFHNTELTLLGNQKLQDEAIEREEKTEK